MSEQATTTPQASKDDMIAINDLDQFIALLTDWHNRQVATIKHLQEAPAGIKVLVGEGTEAVEHVLEGKFREGFQLGLGLALNYLGVLPFMAEYSDEPSSTKH